MTAVLRFAFAGWIVFALCVRPAVSERAYGIAECAEMGDFDRVRELLDQGADPNSSLADGMTVLHWVVYHNELELTRRLLKCGVAATTASRYGVTPLSLASMNGNSQIIELLLDAGADPNIMQTGGETVLMTASRTGVAASVNALLKHGAVVDAVEHQGQTALMWAAAEGNLDAVATLLDAKADYTMETRSGFNAFFFAVREGKKDVALRLLKCGFDINGLLQPQGRKGPDSGNGTNALLLAIENGHFELAAALLDAGAHANDHPAGYTPLHALTWVRKPIRGDGDPPPHGSGNMPSLEMARKLVASGADVNARLEHGTSGRGRFSTTGATPFLMAVRASDVPLAQLLLELGADPKIPNADQSPPLLAAAGVGALGDGDETAGTEDEAMATLQQLLKLGADINAVDNNGETAMHGAAYQSWPKVVRLLSAHGANANIWSKANQWGWTPLMIAEGHRPGNFRPSPDTIDAIREAMAAAGVETPASSSSPPERNDYSSDNKPQPATKNQ